MNTAELDLTGDIRWGLGGAGDMPKGHGSLRRGASLCTIGRCAAG